MTELSKEIRILIRNAPEKPLNTTYIYDELLIEPWYNDSWSSGYRDLNIFGLNKNDQGISVEKITTKDVLNIDSLFKKLKGFAISIDIPYPDNIIHISCRGHLIKVIGTTFKFIKDKRR